VGTDEPLIPKHGGYRKLKSFQVVLAQRLRDALARLNPAYIIWNRCPYDGACNAWRHRKPLNRVKSASLVTNSQPCSIASAAM
jgi:hypothetical protein